MRKAGTAEYERREPATTAPITAMKAPLAQRPASLPSARMAAEPDVTMDAWTPRAGAARGGGGRGVAGCRGGGAGTMAGAYAPGAGGGIAPGGADVLGGGGGSATGRTGGAARPGGPAAGADGSAGGGTTGGTQPSAAGWAARAGPRSRRGGSG